MVDKFLFCSVENQRRTRYFSRTSNPEWNQTMVYPNLQPSDLAKRSLEVTAWNYQADRPNEFLGEVVLDLSGKYIGGQHTLITMRPVTHSGNFAVIF